MYHLQHTVAGPLRAITLPCQPSKLARVVHGHIKNERLGPFFLNRFEFLFQFALDIGTMPVAVFSHFHPICYIIPSYHSSAQSPLILYIEIGANVICAPVMHVLPVAKYLHSDYGNGRRTHIICPKINRLAENIFPLMTLISCLGKALLSMQFLCSSALY